MSGSKRADEQCANENFTEERAAAHTDPVAQEADGDESDQTRVDEADPAVLRATIARLQAETAECRDRMLRTVAEGENVRRRAEQDAANARKYAIERFVTELLPVHDSLERARTIDQRDAGVTEAFIAGLDLTLQLMDSALEKFSVAAVNPLGERFNPDRQQAMTMVESDTVPSGHVVEVVQKGFLLHDRLLRPALVVVAKARS
ncbi:MAG: nucleotide exchange factor GrpE [Acidiferrobacter sp.]